jgi:Bacterial capsule synthesis protein PGA_cap
MDFGRVLRLGGLALACGAGWTLAQPTEHPVPRGFAASGADPVTCETEYAIYGGRLVFQPDPLQPYAEQTQEVGRRFRLKVVWASVQAPADTLKIYVQYWDGSQFAVLQQSLFGPAQLTAARAAQGRLSGVQWLYSPDLGRQLRYECRLGADTGPWRDDLMTAFKPTIERPTPPSWGPAPNDAERVSMAFVGDVMLDETPGRLIRQGVDPLRQMAHLLRQSDVRIANLETVVATIGQPMPDKIYAFRAHPRVLPMMRRHFDAVSLANNHTGDQGPEALAQMLGLVDAAGLGRMGAGYDLTQAHRPWVIERKGIRIAVLAYNEFFPRHFEADHDKPGIAWSEDDQVVRDIQQARERDRADVVIAFMHWGVEYEPLASPRQRRLARLMIEAGADAVVGAHPHVTQEIETHLGRPIFYSLGNFVFDGFNKPEENTAWLLRLEVDRQGVRDWRVHVARIDAQGRPWHRPEMDFGPQPRPILGH